LFLGSFNFFLSLSLNPQKKRVSITRVPLFKYKGHNSHWKILSELIIRPLYALLSSVGGASEKVQQTPLISQTSVSGGKSLFVFHFTGNITQ
jgi:hypothetical protein